MCLTIRYQSVNLITYFATKSLSCLDHLLGFSNLGGGFLKEISVKGNICFSNASTWEFCTEHVRGFPQTREGQSPQLL